MRRRERNGGGSEFDRQWQPIEPIHELLDLAHGVVVERDGRTSLDGSVDEELGGIAQAVMITRQRSEVEHRFPDHFQPRPARDEQRRAGDVEQAVRQLCDLVCEVLTVVQHQEKTAIGTLGEQCVGRVTSTGLEPERTSHR
jgi:hypothetical protein